MSIVPAVKVTLDLGDGPAEYSLRWTNKAQNGLYVIAQQNILLRYAKRLGIYTPDPGEEPRDLEKKLEARDRAAQRAGQMLLDGLEDLDVILDLQVARLWAMLYASEQSDLSLKALMQRVPYGVEFAPIREAVEEAVRLAQPPPEEPSEENPPPGPPKRKRGRPRKRPESRDSASSSLGSASAITTA